ncbi:MAG: HPr family phosphocarrier protein [Rhodobiaceae bacterium]|nr:HPr family phosphocarrier protein [Rhodobiaceae bacterium]MCC0015606.1 HPr family phosphocarrier protein [Rhodobiaceae bacterium]MCC0042700.1 HPr family phosphocarrier protein [Rhodobiaceae bacterium]MCC0054202.1 HPr family phosphocarrier protein [Rhodobiaceae bacterium]
MTQDVTEAAEAVFADTGAVRTLVTICNAKGLHARASAKFVRLAEQFDAEIGVRRDGSAVGGTSIMGLMMLAAAPGCDIEIAATGTQADAAVAALAALVAEGFGENGADP